MASAIKGRHLVAIGFVSLTFIIYWWDRTGFSVELIEIRKAFHFSAPNAGLLSSISVLGLVIMSIPAGVIVQRVGVGWGLIAGTIVFSLATLYTAFAPGFAAIFAARVITGVGEALFNVAIYTYLGGITLRYRGTSIGYTGILIGIGGFTGPLVVSGMLSATGKWQAAFVLLAATGLLGAVLMAVTKGWLLPGARSASPHETGTVDWSAFREVLRPWFIPVAFTVLVGGYMTYANIAAYESFLRTVHHFSLGQASLIVGLNGAGAIVASVPLGYWGDRTGRKFALIWTTPAEGVLLAAQYWVPGHAVVLSAATILGGAVNVNLYNQAFAVVQDFVTPRARSAAVGATSVCFFVGGAFAGYIFLAVEGTLHSYAAAALLTLTVPAVLAALVLAVMMPRQAPVTQDIKHKQVEAV